MLSMDTAVSIIAMTLSRGSEMPPEHGGHVALLCESSGSGHVRGSTEGRYLTVDPVDKLEYCSCTRPISQQQKFVLCITVAGVTLFEQTEVQKRNTRGRQDWNFGSALRAREKLELNEEA